MKMRFQPRALAPYFRDPYENITSLSKEEWTLIRTNGSCDRECQSHLRPKVLNLAPSSNSTVKNSVGEVGDSSSAASSSSSSSTGGRYNAYKGPLIFFIVIIGLILVVALAFCCGARSGRRRRRAAGAGPGSEQPPGGGGGGRSAEMGRGAGRSYFALLSLNRRRRRPGPNSSASPSPRAPAFSQSERSISGSPRSSLTTDHGAGSFHSSWRKHTVGGAQIGMVPLPARTGRTPGSGSGSRSGCSCSTTLDAARGGHQTWPSPAAAGPPLHAPAVVAPPRPPPAAFGVTSGHVTPPPAYERRDFDQV